MYPFDERFFDSLGLFSAYLCLKSRIAYDDQVGGVLLLVGCWGLMDLLLVFLSS